MAAAPACLKRFGEPAAPVDLQNNAAVVFMFHGAPRPWEFRTPDGIIAITPEGPVRTNDAEHIRAAARAGLGICHGASWLFATDIASGAVRRVLDDFAPPPYPINAISSASRLLPGRARDFIEFLNRICAQEPTLKIR